MRTRLWLEIGFFAFGIIGLIGLGRFYLPFVLRWALMVAWALVMVWIFLRRMREMEREDDGDA